MDVKHLVPGDPVLIENIMSYLKAKGIFDEFRHECLADVDTKSSCQNLSQRVDGYTTKFLSGEAWNPDLNKNELRNKLRRHIDESGMLAVGADHVVEQVINPKINQLFLPKIIEVVHQYLNEEKEKLNKKKESSNENISSEKPTVENLEGILNKSKSTILDPVADILSFSYAKPKQTNPSQNVQVKGTDSSKAERKKDEPSCQVKTFEAMLKTEKKKEETISLAKTPDVSSKLKKEDSTVQTKISEVLQNTEKKKEDILPVKIEPVDSTIESSSLIPIIPKSQNETKELNKLKKEIKTEDIDAPSDISKKIQKEEYKQEKKKDDAKLPNSDASCHSEESNQVKSSVPSTKSSSVSKHKSDGDKGKKYKFHGSSKISSNPNEARKSKIKEDGLSTKSTAEKDIKTSVKSSKVSTKDFSSPPKNKLSSKTIKIEKTEESGNKNKAKDVLKSSESHVKTSSSKTSTIKKEINSGKTKSSSNKTEKPKTSKISDYKHQIIKTQTESDKGHKSSFHYSSYDSSQGSDQDRNSTSSSNNKERQKHFSKHYKKESNDKKSGDKSVKTHIEKKRYQSDSDSNTPKKHKQIKNVLDKQKKTLTIQESAKISSRSNSFGSTSSVSDSPSSSKETSASTSEETSDNSSKFHETKKKCSKDRKHCKKTEDFPPPPPPPPSSSALAIGSSSAEISSMDETQSSQESESDSKDSEEESSSESDVENLYSSNTLDSINLESKLKTPEILNDIFDIFLYSSSSSEFEGYSTPEQSISKGNQINDIEVSSVHTSDLSSFDDVLSKCEGSDSENEENKPIGRLTIKEAEKLLEEKAKQRRLEKSKNASIFKSSLNDKKSNSDSQGSNTFSEDDTSPHPERKRESRRERKLNPKYASSEYASIFNSKKTSFITKQMNQNEEKPRNALSLMSFDAKKSEINAHNQKDISLLKQKSSVVDTNAHSSDELQYSNTILSLESPDNTMNEFSSLSSSEHNSEGGIFTSEVITQSNNDNNLGMCENESHGSITLKIKKSVVKTDGETNKGHHPHGLKRKCDVVTKNDAKRICLQNSIISSNSESVANENKPFYNKTNNPSVFSIEKSSKDFFLKQKMNKNGDVLNKIEHVKKKSLSKPNHVAEKQQLD